MSDRIEEGFRKVDEIAETNHNNREKLLGKLMGYVDGLELDVNKTASKDLEAALGIFTTADSVMKSQEASKVTALRLAMQEKSDEDNSNVAASVVNLLNMVKTGDVPKASSVISTIDISKSDKEIESRFEEECDSINSAELEIPPDAHLDTI